MKLSSTYENDCGTLNPLRTSVGSSSFLSLTTRRSDMKIADSDPEKYELNALLEIPAPLVFLHVADTDAAVTPTTSAIPTIFFTGDVE